MRPIRELIRRMERWEPVKWTEPPMPKPMSIPVLIARLTDSQPPPE
jgi:hypothetical protein